MNRNEGIFASDKKSTLEFPELLERVQAFVSQNYASLISKEGGKNKAQLISYIRQYLTQEHLGVENLTTDQLIDRLYTEMAEFSFLTPYLNFTVHNVEGIEINSWEDVKVKLVGGGIEKAEGHFFSPDHARSVFVRLLNKSNITMDSAKPLVRGHLGNKIRITVNGGGGTLDEDVGIAASIRFVNPNNLKRENLIGFGTATEEMLDFLCAAYRYGISMLLAGETDAGKTTIMSIIMSSLPNDKKLYTIENGTREFDLEKRDPDGYIINNVVHTITKESEDPKQAITQQMLLEHGMTMNPDYICMAEIKGSEAFEAIEAALTGHPVIGTTHTDCCENIPDRLVQLASFKSSNLSDKTLYLLAVKAFPLVFYAEKMPDNVRRITEICECQMVDEKPQFTTLYQFVTVKNEEVDGKIIVDGHFEKCGTISEHLQKRLRKKGIPEKLLQVFTGGEKP
jgi:pilus assembly protein CpaF